MQSIYNADLINTGLFGNDAGDVKTRLGFVRSRKGMGKSALLRQIYFTRQNLNEGELIIYIKASELAAMQDIDTSSPAALTHGWQQRICSRVNLELGSTIRFAGNDDSITLVEGAEIAGFRGRNLASALFDRLKIKGKEIEITRERLQMGDAEKLLKRFSERKISQCGCS